ncbi:hypothetical protein Tco_0709010 [Tanacetum coccineum]
MFSSIPISTKTNSSVWSPISHGSENVSVVHGLPADIYSHVNHHRVAKDLWERVQLLMQCTSLTKQERECEGHMQGKMHSAKRPRNHHENIKLIQIIPHKLLSRRNLIRMIQDCDDLSTAQAVLMANISNYGSDIILEVPNFETYLNDMEITVSVAEPTLYDGVVMSNTHVAMPVIDDEETLILEEESRSKMSEKAKVPKVIAKKISHKPIDYKNLNSLIDDFEKRFSPQQELSAEQAFWFRIVNPTIEPSYTQPIIVDVPSELPKVSLVNASLKKLKFHRT